MMSTLRRLGLTTLEILGVVAFYILVSSMISWPTARAIDQVVIGGGELGGWLWRYWWHFKEVEALGGFDVPPVELWNVLIALGRHPETGNILDVLFISWPLSHVLDFPAHYNVKVLLILVLDGLCGYALARRFSRGRIIALAAGLIAVVNPLNIQDVNGSGLRQCILWWLLLYPIFLDRAARRQSFLDAIAAGFCLAMAAAWYWFYGLFAAIFTVLYVVVIVVSRRTSWQGLLRWTIPLGIVGVGLAWPFVRPYFAADESGSTGSLPEMSFFLPFPRYETIEQAPFRPTTYAENVLASLHRAIRSSWAADYIIYPTSERTLPFVVVLLGIVPAVVRRKNGFYLLVFFFFYLASLGPFLKLQTLRDASDVFRFNGWDFDWVVRMPFTLLFRWVPGMARLFAPYRISAMVVVASVVLVAQGIDAIPTNTRNSGRVRFIICSVAMLATVIQMTYRFEIQEVSEGGFQPSRWRAPIKVSRIEVPQFYQDLDPEKMEGIIELPLGREQDLLCYYQVYHAQKVYRSWATSGALPPLMTRSGGGRVGDRLRYLVRQLPLDFPGAELLDRISARPAEVPIDEIDPDALGTLATAGSFRYLIVHERGYYLVHPYHGPVLYRDAVQRLTAGLGIEPTETIEHAWVDYPGNQYDVPDGPVYIPWSAEEIALPDQEMPRRLYMAVFDLSPLWKDATEIDPVTGKTEPEREETAPATPGEPSN